MKTSRLYGFINELTEPQLEKVLQLAGLRMRHLQGTGLKVLQDVPAEKQSRGNVKVVYLNRPDDDAPDDGMWW